MTLWQLLCAKGLDGACEDVTLMGCNSWAATSWAVPTFTVGACWTAPTTSAWGEAGTLSSHGAVGEVECVSKASSASAAGAASGGGVALLLASGAVTATARTAEKSSQGCIGRRSGGVAAPAASGVTVLDAGLDLLVMLRLSAVARRADLACRRRIEQRRLSKLEGACERRWLALDAPTRSVANAFDAARRGQMRPTTAVHDAGSWWHAETEADSFTACLKAMGPCLKARGPSPSMVDPSDDVGGRGTTTTGQCQVSRAVAGSVA
eukprot:5936790-Prymnesium_polylepis.2